MNGGDLRSYEDSPQTSTERKYQLLLQVSEAANDHLELREVLSATARVLCPVVPFDLISVTKIVGEVVRPVAFHVVGVEGKSDESAMEALARGLHVSADQLNDRFPLRGSAVEYVARTGRAYVTSDLAATCRFPDDDNMLSVGIRTYVRAPLFVRDRLVGSISFSRLKPHPFRPEEVTLLEDISRPVATAVSNSIAFDEIRRLQERISAENTILQEQVQEHAMFEEIVGRSKTLMRVLSRIERVAATDSTVLITGETGTGKELVARAIHRRSSRSSRTLIKVNCAALPGSLVTSELFGHERGAFTGATHQRIGRFELASGGSIFLDEIGELPADIQVMLLRVLQEGEFERVGGTRSIRTDARIIAATNADLARSVEEGTFRSDLLYRLNVFPIDMPALRERTEDIPLLAQYYARRFATRMGKKVRAIRQESLDRLMAYPWPGNVRELQNVVERAVVLSDEDVLRIDEADVRLNHADQSPVAAPALTTDLRAAEKRRICEALKTSRGIIAGPKGAATMLGVPNTTLESKIKRLGIDKYRFRSQG